MKSSILVCLLALACAGCTKAANPLNNTVVDLPSALAPSAPAAVLYTIKKGGHSCDKSTLSTVTIDSLSFAARFDSSAVYTTQIKENQYDINKLFGFSDNAAQHHQFSARFGWRWSDGALRLFAYVYNNGMRREKELGTVAIGAWASCSIRVAGSHYLFTLNGNTTVMPRSSTTVKASGYLLFPYFGGNEVAPHDVRIEIRTGQE